MTFLINKRTQGLGFMDEKKYEEVVVSQNKNFQMNKNFNGTLCRNCI